jgi:GNAT superfamily N-acetyltransferase
MIVDGPRALRDDEWEQLDALVSTTFGRPMLRYYPQLFDAANRANLRVIADDARIVSHVGMIERPATLAGCRIDVACVGAVATADVYRGRGHASLLFQDACAKAAADGIDLMLISGSRGLYTRVGCRRVGQDLDFAIAAGDASRASAVPIGPETIPELIRLHATEPVRFIRTREDWERAFACRIVMAREADFWGLTQGSSLIAFLIVNPPAAMRRAPNDPAIGRVAEYAGDRAAIAAALPWLRERYQAERLTIHVAGNDPILRARLESDGHAATPAPTWGSVRIINFPRLLDRCRPLLAAGLGDRVAQRLVFAADEPPGSPGGGFTIQDGAESVRLPDLGTLAAYLFGEPGRPLPRLAGSPVLTARLATALPLPALWYGITYV